MFKNKFVKLGIIAAVLVVLVYSFTMNTSSYEDTITTTRDEYETSLRSMEPSPLGGQSGEISYFPIDESWKITVVFEEDIAVESFPIFMSDGSVEELHKAGTASFTMDGKEIKVTLFDEGETFMLPFTDLLSGSDTYGGGRYVNIAKSNNNKLEIDFNKAHNFYCAYSELFVCPVPPASNKIDLAISAGEKSFK